MLEDMRIKTPAGLSIPLKEVTDYSLERGEVSIRHYNGKREILIEGDLIDPYASVPEILQNVKKEIIPNLEANFPGVEVSFRGQQRNADKSSKSGGLYAIIAIFIMFLIIALNFNSVYQAFLIVFMLPLGVFGAILGHGIENLPVSILSAWGIIALLGILVNDSVVYLDTYNRNLLDGMSVKEAIYDAGIRRFRPIILTSITTVVGLYPLILENSFQAQFLIPMATSVAYGVLFGTIFILLFFPVIVLVMNDVRRGLYWLWNGTKISRIDVEPVIQRKDEIKKIEL
jgi:multidrug efflux pump subunit AcrB